MRKTTEDRSASEAMAALGIVQDGDPMLAQVTAPFDLPGEVDEARRVVAALSVAMTAVRTVHEFRKGVGIAAPQIGVRRRAALVRSAGSHATIALLNPRVVDEAGSDDKYEGCLSFFDVRGMVTRPLELHVEHQGLDGKRQITLFRQGEARLVSHEIDHLDGVLYTKRMPPGAPLVPVAEYRKTDQGWTY